jgi:hypothetical protein
MPLQYFELNDGSDKVPNNLLACMLRMRCECNPDFQASYASVARWYVEFDPVQRVVLREVGLNSQGFPVTLGPFGRNDGFWTGVSTGINIDARRALQIEIATFEADWKTLEDVYRERIPPKQIEPRLPVHHDNQLLGAWSASILEGPLGMGDQVISFVPGGKGYFADYNVSLMYYHEFQWDLVDAGHVSIHGIACYEEDEEARPSHFRYDSISVETQRHHFGNGKSVEVLYLPLANEHLRWVGNAFGRCPIDAANIGRPKFSR